MGRNVGRVVAAVIVAGLFATACGSSGGSGGGAYGAGAASSSSPNIAGSSDSGSGGRYGYGSSSGSDSGSSGGGVSVLTLTQVNYRFSPAMITVHHGDTLTVSDTNPSTPHTFTIESSTIDVANQPQQSQDVTIDLEPGTYTFYCRFHRSSGMEGTLVVT